MHQQDDSLEALKPKGSAALAGTVVYIVRWRADGDLTFQGPLARKAAAHGARVVTRMSKDVTHVLLQLKPLPSPSEWSLEQDKLRELYSKLDKVTPPPVVVTPLWVQDTIKQARRAEESLYLIPRPQDLVFLHVTKQGPNKPSGAAVANSRRVSALLQPPEPLDVDLDADIFSSSQQIRLGPDEGTKGGITAAAGKGTLLSYSAQQDKSTSEAKSGWAKWAGLLGSKAEAKPVGSGIASDGNAKQHSRHGRSSSGLAEPGPVGAPARRVLQPSQPTVSLPAAPVQRVGGGEMKGDADENKASPLRRSPRKAKVSGITSAVNPTGSPYSFSFQPVAARLPPTQQAQQWPLANSSGVNAGNKPGKAANQAAARPVDNVKQPITNRPALQRLQQLETSATATAGPTSFADPVTVGRPSTAPAAPVANVSLLQQALATATVTPNGAPGSAQTAQRKQSARRRSVPSTNTTSTTPVPPAPAATRTPCLTPTPNPGLPKSALAAAGLSRGGVLGTCGNGQGSGGASVTVPKLKGSSSGAVTPVGGQAATTPQVLALAAAKLTGVSAKAATAGVSPAGLSVPLPAAQHQGQQASGSTATPLCSGARAGVSGAAFGSAIATPLSVIDLTGPTQDVQTAAKQTSVADDSVHAAQGLYGAAGQVGTSGAVAVTQADARRSQPSKPPHATEAPGAAAQAGARAGSSAHDQAEDRGCHPSAAASPARHQGRGTRMPQPSSPQQPAGDLPLSPTVSAQLPAQRGAPASQMLSAMDTPGSVLRTASRVPPGSDIIGTPMTTPHYYTRLQRQKYNRLGLDLEELPRCKEFVVQEDGTVFVPGREEGVDLAEPAGEGEACSRRLPGVGEGTKADPEHQASSLRAALSEPQHERDGCASGGQGTAVPATETEVLAAGCLRKAQMCVEGPGAGPSTQGDKCQDLGTSSAAVEPSRRGRKRRAEEAELARSSQQLAVSLTDAQASGGTAAPIPAVRGSGSGLDVPADSAQHAHMDEAPEDVELPLKRRRITLNEPAAKANLSLGGQGGAALGTGNKQQGASVQLGAAASKGKRAAPTVSRGSGLQKHAVGVAGAGKMRQMTLSPFLHLGAGNAATAPKPQQQLQAANSRKGALPSGKPALPSTGHHSAQHHQASGSREAPASSAIDAGPSTSRPTAIAAGREDMPAGSRYRYYLACTAVDVQVSGLLKAAVRQLGDAKLCAEGYEGGLVTHLLVGRDVRTLKVLLAIASGARLLSPQWLQDSVALGCWQPEEQYRAQCRFTDIADKVRSRMAQQPSPPRVLEGRQVSIHCVAGSREPVAAGRKVSDHKTSLQRLVVALGGRVVPPRCCDVCVVGGTAQPPSSVGPDTKVVSEEWLLTIAERQEALAVDEYLV